MPTPPTRGPRKGKVAEILKQFSVSPPRATQEAIPKNFTPSKNFTKRGDYPLYVHIATAFVEEKNPGIEFDIANGYYIDSEREAHVYFPQTHHGLDIANAAADVAVRPESNKVDFASNNFYRGELPEDRPLDRMDFSSPLEALGSLIALLQLSLYTDTAYAEPVPGQTQNFIIRGIRGLHKRAQGARVKLVYFVHDGQIFLTWGVDLHLWRDYFSAYVDARSPSHIITAWSNRLDFAASDA
ncbi:hypothetical protein VMCG_03190 [Cytospora schulzeri]|uniref:Uncharacterized protein n=1 Tax=Cytospora schulzeri TaxID=448051 RepID=A0A423WXV8_9PEZI|nr:hypothetical protein VMCG_03190 [Valsa malicola]